MIYIHIHIHICKYKYTFAVKDTSSLTNVWR